MCKLSKELDKPKLIVWSGGLDSTALVIDAVKLGLPFNTVYFNIGNNSYKGKIEIAAREKIKKALIERYEITGWVDRVIDIATVGPGVGGQALIWLFGLASLNTSGYDEIQMGYIRGDDLWHIKREFIEAYKAMKAVSNSAEEPAPLVFPIEWHTKEDIARAFSKSSFLKRIARMTWTCDIVLKKGQRACGKCHSCVDRKTKVMPILNKPMPSKKSRRKPITGMKLSSKSRKG